MNKVKHTPECLAADAKLRAVWEAWTDAWPNACDYCKGHGVFFSGGGSFYDPPSMDPCDMCTDKGICARCGSPDLTSEERGDSSTGEGPCKACGWNYNDAEPELRQEPCSCEEEYMQEEGI